MNRFQKYCMREAKKMIRENIADGSIFDLSHTDTYQIYKSHMTMYSKAKLEDLLASYKKHYFITDKSHTYPYFKEIIDRHANYLLPYWVYGDLANKEHLYYLIGRYTNPVDSSREVAIIQDVSTQQVYLIESYVVKEAN